MSRKVSARYYQKNKKYIQKVSRKVLWNDLVECEKLTAKSLNNVLGF